MYLMYKLNVARARRVYNIMYLVSHLHVADSDAVVDAVPHHLVLHLFPPAEGLLHQDLIAQRQRFAPQFPVVVLQSDS